MEVVKVFKALSDASRLRALYALREHELCVCQIVELLGLAPSTVSKHMSILSRAELVTSTKKGRWVYFRATQSVNAQAGRILTLLPGLVDHEAEIEEDRQSLRRILELDPEVLCRMQSNK